MLCLLTQPQKELQLNLKTNNTQNYQKKHQAVWKSNNQGFKDQQRGEETCVSPREVEAVEWAGTVLHSHVVDKNREEYLERE